MKDIIKFISYILFFIFVLSFSAFADIQEEIRNYLRNWHSRIGNKAEIARQLGVSKGCLDPFIKDNSTTSSPTIVNNFREKFSLHYQGLMETLKRKNASFHHLPLLFPPSLRLSFLQDLVRLNSLLLHFLNISRLLWLIPQQAQLL
jgi:hypothetical protein